MAMNIKHTEHSGLKKKSSLLIKMTEYFPQNSSPPQYLYLHFLKYKDNILVILLFFANKNDYSVNLQNSSPHAFLPFLVPNNTLTKFTVFTHLIPLYFLLCTFP